MWMERLVIRRAQGAVLEYGRLGTSQDETRRVLGRAFIFIGIRVQHAARDGIM